MPENCRSDIASVDGFAGDGAVAGQGADGGGAGPATAFAPGWTKTTGKTGVEILVGEGYGANGQTGLAANLGEGGVYDGGVLTQILSTTVAANTTYTLDLLVGKRAGFADGWNAAGYSVELLAGTTAFITGGTNANPASGSFAPMSLTFTTGATIDAQPLTIKLSLIASSAQVEFDNVTLDATVPEPASMGLLGLAGISLLARVSAGVKVS